MHTRAESSGSYDASGPMAIAGIALHQRVAPMGALGVCRITAYLGRIL